MASSSGRTSWLARSLRASQMPSGRPISTQKNSAVSTSDSVVIDSPQMPSRPSPSSEASVATASRPPAICHASSDRMPIITSVGGYSSTASTPDSSASTGWRITWKAGRNWSTNQPSAWLIQACTGSAPSNQRAMALVVSAASAAAPGRASEADSRPSPVAVTSRVTASGPPSHSGLASLGGAW